MLSHQCRWLQLHQSRIYNSWLEDLREDTELVTAAASNCLQLPIHLSSLTQFWGHQTKPHQRSGCPSRSCPYKWWIELVTKGSIGRVQLLWSRFKGSSRSGDTESKLPASGRQIPHTPRAAGWADQQDSCHTASLLQDVLAGFRRSSRYSQHDPKHPESRSVVPNPHSQLSGLVVERLPWEQDWEVVGLIPARSQQRL